MNAKAAKPWFTPKIKSLAAEKRRAYIKYLSIKTDEQLHQYVQVRNSAKNKILQIKKDRSQLIAALKNGQTTSEVCTIMKNNQIYRQYPIASTTNEMLKYGGDKLIMKLSYLHSMIMSTGVVP